MNTFSTATMSAVVTFLGLAAMAPVAESRRDAGAAGENHRERALASPPANELTRDLAVAVTVVDDPLPVVSVTVQSNVDADIGFEVETVIANSEGEIVAMPAPFGRAGEVAILLGREQLSRVIWPDDLDPGLYAIRTTVRGGTSQNLQEQIDLLYVR